MKSMQWQKTCVVSFSFLFYLFLIIVNSPAGSEVFMMTGTMKEIVVPDNGEFDGDIHQVESAYGADAIRYPTEFAPNNYVISATGEKRLKEGVINKEKLQEGLSSMRKWNASGWKYEYDFKTVIQTSNNRIEKFLGSTPIIGINPNNPNQIVTIEKNLLYTRL